MGISAGQASVPYWRFFIRKLYHNKNLNLSLVLPCRLSGMGSMRAWPFLQGLHLDHNLLSGSLPASWGSNGAMTSLRNISLTWNYFTGSIPASWGVGANGKPRFQAIKAVVLQPGVLLCAYKHFKWKLCDELRPCTGFVSGSCF